MTAWPDGRTDDTQVRMAVTVPPAAWASRTSPTRMWHRREFLFLGNPTKTRTVHPMTNSLHPTGRPITGHVDPEGESPWAMQLVVRVEKTNPPLRTTACEAVAHATLAALTHPQASGTWKPAFDRWLAGRIRKHVRRARASAWDKVQDLPGVTVEHDGVQVRAFVPGPVDQNPPALAKLQMSGTNLDDTDTRPHAEPVLNGPVIVALSTNPYLPFGKAAAAAAHAAQLTAQTMPVERLSIWAQVGYPLVVTHPRPEDWSTCLNDPVVITDAGLTVVAPGTVTATAHWL